MGLSTAIFSAILLHRRLSMEKWFAVVMLTCGVAVIVAQGDASSKGVMTTGLTAVLVATLLSGLAGVLLEMILKDSSTSIWERNLQLSSFGVIFGLMGVCTELEAI